MSIEEKQSRIALAKITEIIRRTVRQRQYRQELTWTGSRLVGVAHN